MGKDYYAVLGINRSASDADLKHRWARFSSCLERQRALYLLLYCYTVYISYRKLSLKFHPVKNESVGAEEKFAEIAEAYDILSNRKY